MRTWKGWLAKKSAALTRFWLFAYSEIRGTSSVALSGVTTESFIWTNVVERSSLRSFAT